MNRPIITGLGQALSGWLTARELFIEATGNDPLEWQENYLKETRDAIVLKGRQIGASTSAGVLAIRRARYWPGSLCAIVSPSMKQSTEVKERARLGLERLGEPLKRDSQTIIQLMNGSRILSLPGSAKSVRGWSADLLVIDEAAFLDPDTFLAARATVATGGRTIVQSTPAGPYGPFYDMWVEEDSQRAKFMVRSDEATTIDPAFLARERATLGPEEYAQEYEATFTAAGLGLVDPDRLRELTETGPAPAHDPWASLRS